MSEIIVTDDIKVNAAVSINFEENKALLETTNEIITEDKPSEVKVEFVEFIDKFLFQKPDNVPITLSRDIQHYIWLLCKESPELINNIGFSIQKIISDNKIDTKDVPEILLLVNKVYSEINGKKNIQLNIQPYELIKILLHICFIVYIENNQIENTEIINNVLNIIDASISLIKLTPCKPLKVGCFTCIL